MNTEIDFEKIFGQGFLIIAPTKHNDLNAMIPCLPPVCPPFYEFTVIHEEAPAAEATEAPCACQMP